ncbi:MAG: IS3 family transposase [Herminiimonas sp.]|nr:IS3 family transposase [Herminiimonas sp.]
MNRLPEAVYTKQFRDQAVEMVVTDGLAASEAARRLSISIKTLANWIRLARSGKLAQVGQNQVPLTELEVELSRMKRELAELKMERDLLKKFGGLLRQGVAVKYGLVEQMRQCWPVPPMCRLLEVSVSGYYAWRTRAPSRRTQRQPRLEIEILAAHQRTRETFGPERLQRDLSGHGIEIGVHSIKRVRRELGLRCRQKRKFKATTNSQHALPIAPNLLNQNFKVAAPDRVWVTDITYLATDEGWLYLAGLKDLYSGELVGYAMGARMTKNLVMQALIRAVAARRTAAGLVCHSDRGSQYCAHAYRRLLDQFGMTASMSRKGNCYDDASIESFRGTLKNELVHHRRYITRRQAKDELTEYIEMFYNRQRTQARLGYVLPAVFTQHFYLNQLVA